MSCHPGRAWCRQVQENEIRMGWGGMRWDGVAGLGRGRRDGMAGWMDGWTDMAVCLAGASAAQEAHPVGVLRQATDHIDRGMAHNGKEDGEAWPSRVSERVSE